MPYICLHQNLFTCRPLSSGLRGEIVEVNGNQVAVLFDNEGDTSSEGSKKKPTEKSRKLHMHWIDGIIYFIKLYIYGVIVVCLKKI